jgi:hypothetical protein
MAYDSWVPIQSLLWANGRQPRSAAGRRGLPQLEASNVFGALKSFCCWSLFRKLNRVRMRVRVYRREETELKLKYAVSCHREAISREKRNCQDCHGTFFKDFILEKAESVSV